WFISSILATLSIGIIAFINKVFATLSIGIIAFINKVFAERKYDPRFSAMILSIVMFFISIPYLYLKEFIIILPQ
ncbi:MAG: hypothetical protein KC550_07320, partial [Nanoarchaeota archaeon]|nr:hypothetical protein [Nanoarchaeota archaeon]